MKTKPKKPRNFYVEACLAADDKDGPKLRRVMRALVVQALTDYGYQEAQAKQRAKKLVHK